jgi:hypothetical protein
VKPVKDPVIDPHRPEPPRRLRRGAEQLATLVGQRLLVGITYLDGSGQVNAAEQFCGRVLEVGDGVVVVERPGDGEPAVLPADAAAYERAAAGSYTLKSTGEVVRNPDYVTTWHVAVTPPDGTPRLPVGPMRPAGAMTPAPPSPPQSPAPATNPRGLTVPAAPQTNPSGVHLP